MKKLLSPILLLSLIFVGADSLAQSLADIPLGDSRGYKGGFCDPFLTKMILRPNARAENKLIEKLLGVMVSYSRAENFVVQESLKYEALNIILELVKCSGVYVSNSISKSFVIFIARVLTFFSFDTAPRSSVLKILNKELLFHKKFHKAYVLGTAMKISLKVSLKILKVLDVLHGTFREEGSYNWVKSVLSGEKKRKKRF